MGTGLQNRLTGQVGEFLVSAELGREGLVATPFAGNVPGYDLIATDEHFTSVPIQVKTSTQGSWQLSVDKLVDITFDPDTQRQTIHGLKDLANPDLIFVFVWLGDRQDRHDRFFVLTHRQFQEIAASHHESYLAQHDWVRPRTPSSFHASLKAEHFERYENNWGLVREQLAARRRTAG